MGHPSASKAQDSPRADRARNPNLWFSVLLQNAVKNSFQISHAPLAEIGLPSNFEWGFRVISDLTKMSSMALTRSLIISTSFDSAFIFSSDKYCK
jgi:hypothetical protein